MAVIATDRCRIWDGELVRERAAIRRIEKVLALAKLAFLAAVVLLVWSIGGGRTAFRTLTNEATGIRISYPARWQWAEAHLACSRAAEARGNVNWEAYQSLHGPPGVAVCFLALPVDLYRLGPWGQALPVHWEADHLLAVVTAHLRYLPEGLRVRETRLLGARAVEVAGPRLPDCWGSTVVGVEGATLMPFDAVAPTRSRFQAFDPTWKRMVRRAQRVSDGDIAPLWASANGQAIDSSEDW